MLLEGLLADLSGRIEGLEECPIEEQQNSRDLACGGIPDYALARSFSEFTSRTEDEELTASIPTIPDPPIRPRVGRIGGDRLRRLPSPATDAGTGVQTNQSPVDLPLSFVGCVESGGGGRDRRLRSKQSDDFHCLRTWAARRMTAPSNGSLLWIPAFPDCAGDSSLPTAGSLQQIRLRSFPVLTSWVRRVFCNRHLINAACGWVSWCTARISPRRSSSYSVTRGPHPSDMRIDRVTYNPTCLRD